MNTQYKLATVLMPRFVPHAP